MVEFEPAGLDTNDHVTLEIVDVSPKFKGAK
jgi:hypothetical protein